LAITTQIISHGGTESELVVGMIHLTP